MLKRQISERLHFEIANVPAVTLPGARQVGKTTLAKNVAKGLASIYLDLEAPEDLLKLNAPASFSLAALTMGLLLVRVGRDVEAIPYLKATARGSRQIV